jgi:hypothetical protein
MQSIWCSKSDENDCAGRLEISDATEVEVIRGKLTNKSMCSASLLYALKSDGESFGSSAGA